MKLIHSQYRQLFWVLGAFTLVRLAVAPFFGFGVDEAHYLLYGYHLDWSYVDHPPLVGWIHAFILFCTKGGEFFSRIPAIALMIVTSVGAYRFLLSAGADHHQALWGITALNASFMFGALGLMLLPENLLMALLFPLMESVLRIERTGKARDFVLLGILLGALGLSKYTAILFIPAILGYFLAKRRFDLFANPRTLLSVSLALIMISPVILWNQQHDWISFLYQSEHVAGGTAIALKPFFKSLAGQIGAYNPLLYVIALFGWIGAFRSSDDTVRLALWIGTTIALFFLVSSFLKPVLPHWPALFYLLFIPLGTVMLLRRGWDKTVKGVILFSALLSLLIHAELVFKWGHFPDYKSPFRDIYGYDRIAGEADALFRGIPSTKKALAVTNWTYGSRILYYTRPYGEKVFTLDTKNRQFSLWEAESPVGYDLLIITSHFTADAASAVVCTEYVPLGNSVITLEGGIVDTFTYTLCRNYRGER
ncbi:glycosyltransferase family 39 protein [uncultured Sulfuricurvum sp.]|uniref:glycosyltransferase family 39 protein n=1 Tax=uncultured Sulfuricurvum sp. TaxID=430693 RepID=UPI00263534C5|nr:glycosyltransferase family 39 protein [uncultured Sulfuricurvum sp.]